MFIIRLVAEELFAANKWLLMRLSLRDLSLLSLCFISLSCDLRVPIGENWNPLFTCFEFLLLPSPRALLLEVETPAIPLGGGLVEYILFLECDLEWLLVVSLLPLLFLLPDFKFLTLILSSPPLEVALLSWLA